MNAPDVTKDTLIADERAAEQAVVSAEVALRLAEAEGDPDMIARARAAVDQSRATSLATRQRMQEGLAAWSRYAAYQEAVAHAQANGVPLGEGYR